MAVLAGQKNVAAVATPEQLAGATAATYVTVQAKPSNTKSVFLGNNTTQLLELVPGASIATSLTNLNQLFVRVQVAGEGVTYLGTT
jgi:hypothetical protein